MGGKTFAGDALPSDRFAITSRFEVEIDGSIVATFSECSGLGVTVATDKIEEGGYNKTTRKLPGRTDFTNLTLKHGILHTTDMFDWFRQVVRGEFARKDLSIRVFNQEMSEILTWQFLRAFPVKWTGPTLQVTANSTAVETLELAHDGFVTV